MPRLGVVVLLTSGVLRSAAQGDFLAAKPDATASTPPTGLEVQAVSGFVDVTTLHWNSHRPCATEIPDCIAQAQRSLGVMVRKVGAKVVGTVELRDASKGLPGWQTTGAQVDHATIMVAPGWQIAKSGGWAMGGNRDKGFAVALVVPPEPVKACPALCAFMGHVPHPSHAIDGFVEIDRVCGAAGRRCMIAMADWNSAEIDLSWRVLMHDTPTLVEPRSNTCCFADGFSFSDDHTSTNIAGAFVAASTAFDPQLTKFPSVFEHRPTSVQLKLPRGA